MNPALGAHLLQESRLAYLLCDARLQVLEVGGDPSLLSPVQAPAPGPEPEAPHLSTQIPELEALEESIHQVLQGTLPSLEFPRVTRSGPDGSPRYLSIRLSRLAPDLSPPAQLLCLVRDVTEQGQVEQALMQQRNELALLKEQLERQNQVLTVANWELALANRLRNAFVALVGHKLRTPLTGLLGQLELLLEEPHPLPDPIRAQLHRLADHAQALLTTVQTMVDALRIEADQVELLLVPHPLRPLLDEAVARIQPVLRLRGQRLMVHWEPPDLCLLCDRRRCIQILEHLLGLVARRAPQAATLQVTVRLAENHDVEIAITAEGFQEPPLDQIPPPRHLPPVHQDGRWLDMDTGLSLFLAHGFMEFHGGSLELRSDEQGQPHLVVTFPSLDPDPSQELSSQPLGSSSRRA